MNILKNLLKTVNRASQDSIRVNDNEEGGRTADHDNKPLFTHDMTVNLRPNMALLYETKPEHAMTCVEIGSYEGCGSIFIIDYLCKHKDSILYCIDPFDNEYVKGSEKMAFWNSACNGQYDRFKHNTSNVSKIIEKRGYSDSMIQTLDDNSIDFCYIDGDHSPEQVYKDIVNVFIKMKNNSIVLFDDYLWEMNGVVTKGGIDRFLDEYTGKYELLLSNFQLAIRIIK
jgi:predicted O-methyltransferase YrrM